LGLKGMGVSGSPKSKDVNQDASVVDLRDKKQPYTLDSSVVRGGTPQLRKEVQGDFKNVVSQRENVGENAQVQAILDSFKSGEPSVPTKNLKDLAPGDVILVAPDSLLVKGSDETGIHFVNFLESNGINLLDRFGSNNWSSPASHAAIFIGSRDGKRWYLDNTSKGPVIKNEATFLREYGHRQMDVATLVGQPLSQHEGQELWKGAYELQNTTSYGIKMLKFNGDDAMVCSESSRWLLLRAGRRVNESQSTDVNLGITSLNKKEFVKFSPADFYDQQQYFIIHQLYLK